MRGLALVVVGLVVLGPSVAAYWLVPPEVLHAWPIYALTLLPTFAVVVTSLVFRGYRPLLDAPLRDTAAAWLRSRLRRTRATGINVAAVERGERQRGSFYHPASQTIILSDDVHGEHTARAYATAAHELGHALLYSTRPRLARVLMAARARAATCSHIGIGMLLGSVLVCAPGVRVAASILLGLAVLLQALVVLDETIATTLAARELKDVLCEADQRAAARGHLRRALATYISTFLAYIATIAIVPWLVARVGEGLLVTAPPLAGAGSAIATVIAVACLIGAVGCLGLMRTGRLLGLLAGVAALLTVFWTPLLVALVCAQPGIPGWTVALGTVPAAALLTAPAFAMIQRLAQFLGQDLDVMPLPFLDPRTRSIQRVSIASLARREESEGWLSGILSSAYVFLIVPLAIAWLAL